MAAPSETIALAVQHLNAGQEQEARKLLASITARRPTDAPANRLLAMIAGAHGDDAAASLHLQRAIMGDPKDAELRFMLGNTLFNQRKYKEAALAYREVIRLNPLHLDAFDSLARSLISLEQRDEGFAIFRRAIEAVPNHPHAYNNFCQALMRLGDMAQAARIAQEGIARAGPTPGLLETAAFTLNFVDHVDHALHRQLHEAMGEVYRARATRPPPAFANSRDPQRPLKVGFLSGDFGHHVCAAFMKPALLHFDPLLVLPFCYHTLAEDGGEGPFKESCHYRHVTNLSDDQLAATITADAIDILVECSGLTPGKRFGALLPRCAPIQCTWLGYPNTTGLPTIDYRLVDAFTDPPALADHCTEHLLRFPRSFLCYTPNPWAGEVRPTPAQRDPALPIVFGSFNRIHKISDATIAAWSRALAAVPNSILLIKLQTLSAQQRAAQLARFTHLGIAPERIELAPWEHDASAHARLYDRVDIALDSFPYNGTTTTCEALWMGCPVIAMEGDSHRSRVGISLLHAVGLEHLIAASPEHFAAIAVSLASDREALMRLRLSLRDIMQRSPLRDESGYTRDFEALLRQVWLAWLADVR